MRSRHYVPVMRQLLLGTRRPSTVAEALLAAVVFAAVLAAGLYLVSGLMGDVDHGRILTFVVVMPLVRLLLDAVRLVNNRE